MGHDLTSPPRGWEELNDDEETYEEFEADEDEFTHYAQLAQEDLKR
jgi:hypothetical protein